MLLKIEQPCPVEIGTGLVSQTANLLNIQISTVSPQSSIWLPLASCAGVSAIEKVGCALTEVLFFLEPKSEVCS